MRPQANPGGVVMAGRVPEGSRGSLLDLERVYKGGIH